MKILSKPLLLKKNLDWGRKPLQPSQERVPHSGLRYPEDTTLFGWADHTCHFLSQPFADSRDETRIFKFLTG